VVSGKPSGGASFVTLRTAWCARPAVSFNFTKAAEEKNAENLLVIRGDDALVKKYLANFKEHLEHPERYDRSK